MSNNERNSKFVPGSSVESAREALTKQEQVKPTKFSLREAVEALHDEILKSRQKGLDWDSIVDVLATKGIHIKTTTLRAYVYDANNNKKSQASHGL